MFTSEQLVTLARQHQIDMYRETRTTRPRRKAPPPRERVGWFLVEVGLRLAAQT